MLTTKRNRGTRWIFKIEPTEENIKMLRTTIYKYIIYTEDDEGIEGFVLFHKAYDRRNLPMPKGHYTRPTCMTTKAITKLYQIEPFYENGIIKKRRTKLSSQSSTTNVDQEQALTKPGTA